MVLLRPSSSSSSSLSRPHVAPPVVVAAEGKKEEEEKKSVEVVVGTANGAGRVSPGLGNESLSVSGLIKLSRDLRKAAGMTILASIVIDEDERSEAGWAPDQLERDPALELVVCNVKWWLFAAAIQTGAPRAACVRREVLVLLPADREVLPGRAPVARPHSVAPLAPECE